MITNWSDMIAMHLGYAVMFVGGVLVISLIAMWARDKVMQRWDRRVRTS